MAKLKVSGSASGTGTITLIAPATSTDRTITLPDESITLGGGVDGIVSTANATAITIDSSENVGIGQTSPSALLHTDKASSITNGLIPSLRVDSHTTGTAANGVGTSIEFYGSMTGQAGVELGKVGFENSNVSGAHGDFVVYTRPNAAVVERLKITSDGRGLSQFTAKAWVNLNQQGTQAIRDSHNVSSITDSGTGETTTNFANNLANANYSASATAGGSVWHNTASKWNGTPTVGGFKTGVLSHSGSGSYTDDSQLSIIVFGD
jgi:hypothetical protein